MKRALFLTYDYPPCLAPGAAVRSQKLVQYLPEFGWETAVVCRGERFFANAELQSGVTRIPTPVPPHISYQLGAWLWAASLLPRVRALLCASRFDVLYASCPPFPHALSAVRLAREAGIPLIVDFRDAWSLDPYLGGGLPKRLAKRALCRLVYPPLERRMVESAGALVFCTPSMHAAYARLFPSLAGRFHLVTNGFDEADFRGAVERPARDRPLLLYCGRFFGVADRSPDLLLRALRMVVNTGYEIQFEILGDGSPALHRAIRRFGLTDFARARGPVPHSDALRAMRTADILVVSQPPGRNEVTASAGKTYEYLRCGLPILAVVPPGDNADLIRRYAPVHQLVTTREPAAVAEAIRKLVSALPRAGTPNPTFRAQYNRRHIAERMAGIFDEVVGARTRRACA